MWLNNFAGRNALGAVAYSDEEVNDSGQHFWRSTVQSTFVFPSGVLDILITMFQ